MKPLFLLATVFSLLGYAQAATIKVESNGSGDTTTIAAGLALAIDGDTIAIGPGIYEESVVIDKSVTLLGKGPQYVTVRGQGDRNTITVGDLVNPNPVTVTLDGVSVNSGQASGIYLEPYSDTRIQNCVISDCRYHGIVHDTWNNIKYNSARTYLNIKNTTIANCALYGVIFNARYAGDAVLDNCILHNCNYGDSASVQMTFDSQISGIALTLGRFLRSGKTLFGIGSNRERHDPLYDEPGNPRFINETNGNYILMRGSAAIDRGMPGQVEPDGTPGDLGAYGGPGAARFWPYPVGGPLVKDISVSPGAVTQGGKITLKASATTR